MMRDVQPRAAAGIAVDWKGTPRYEVVRCVGRGGMGVVYEALDRERGQPVALKVLRQFDPAALFMFKKEFRTLADVVHKNLVRLYELSAVDGEQAFIAMELVVGTNFLAHVHQPVPSASGEETEIRPSVRAPGEGDRVTPVATAVPEGGGLPPSPADFDRLRPALRQLVEGVQALHAAGKLHRDIKPSNVLVTTDGRVVLLDFGVATEIARASDRNLREEGQVVGTVKYMAPEQGFGEEALPASDWYSVGAVLYEALVGRLPFEGSAIDVLYAKAMADTPLPSARVSGIPSDLDDLCGSLLDRDPLARPTGPEILTRLGVTRTSIGPGARASARPSSGGWLAEGETALVGRADHLRALRKAFEDAREGPLVTVQVRGQAGMGKSTLVQHFLDELVAGDDAVVLRGRAYERESVPYKAVDAVVDELSRHLIHLLDRGEAFDLPSEVGALARLFPVLRRVPAIGDPFSDAVTDPQRSRLRAFGALRELLARLAERQPLVLFMDDVQWGDVDSAALLLELLRPPRAPPILIVLAVRDDVAQAAPFLSELRARWPEGAELRELSVGPIETADARRLALTILGYDDATGQRAAQAIADEARGSPFLVQELARSSSGTVAAAPDAGGSLRHLVARRMADLPEDARRLAEVIAVAGRPLPVNTLARAAGVHSSDELVAALARQRLVRSGLRSGQEVVEPIHDRIRETIVEGLGRTAVRDHHARLASVLEAIEGADPEAVALHLFGAGDAARASKFAEQAAERASSQLAFDQAARLLTRACEATPDSPSAHRLKIRLAEALVLAGRSEDAARVYAEAARGVAGTERADLERAAAEQLLMCGHMDEGGKLLRSVLESWRMALPRSLLMSILWLLYYRIALAVRGLTFEERDADAVRPEDRARIDALYAVANGLGLVDLFLSACVQARHLVQALNAGHRLQVMRAVSVEASHLAGQGGPEGPREQQLVAVVQRLMKSADCEPHRGIFESRHGIRLFLRGRWRQAREVLDAAYARYPDNRASAYSNSYVFSLYALWFLGDLEELARRKAVVLADAEQRQDLYTLVNLRASWATLTSLASDDVDVARRSVRAAMSLWSHSGFSIQHWQAMVIDTLIELYAGNGPEAHARMTRDARALKKSFLLRGQSLRGQSAYLRGISAIASIDGAAESLRGQRVAEALTAAKALERERMPWTEPLASIVSAAAANARGARDAAVASLRAAVEQAHGADMPLYGEAARHRLGLVLGGQEGIGIATAAEATLARHGVRVPERFAAMLVPGRWVRAS